MRLFDCLVCKSDEESPRRHIQGHVAGRLDADPGRSGQPSPKQQTLNDIQAALLRLEGSWPRRVEGLISLLKEHGLVAKVYGFVKSCGADEWVVLLPDITNGARAGWLDDAERDRLLRQLSSIQAPGAQLLCASQPVFNSQQAPQQHPSRETAAGAAAAPPASTPSPTAETTSAAAAAAAVPLIRSDLLVGALWLQTDTLPIPPPPPPPPPPDPGPYQPRHLHATIGRRPSRGGDAGAAPPSVSALSLLRSSDCLRQLSFAASMCLAAAGGGCGGSDCLPWLSEAVAALRSAPSMQALTAHLCGALTAHVRTRFVLEAETRAAIVPPPTEAGAASHAATTALLFGAQGGGSDAAAADPASGGVPITAGGGGCEGVAASAPVAVIGGGDRHRPTSPLPVQARPSPPNSPMGCFRASAASQHSFKAFPTDDAAAASAGFTLPTGGAAIAVASASAATAASGGANSLWASGSYARGLGLGLANTGTLVVPLSAAEAAAVTTAAPDTAAAALHADAFPLQHTLLLAVLDEQRKQQQQQQQQQEGQQQQQHAQGASLAGAPTGVPTGAATAAATAAAAASGSAAAPALPISVIENLQLYVQNVHNPWRDVWLFMGRQQPGAATPAGVLSHGSSQATVTTTTTAPATTTAAVSGSFPRSTVTAPQSLVLLTLSLREGAALGLYLCFPKRLPGPLLEAVRSSCQELVDKGLSGPIREKLDGSLAAEYDMLKAAAPGSYAVVRGVSLGEDLAASGGGPPNSTSTHGGRHATGFLDSLLRRRTEPAIAAQPPSGRAAIAAAARALALLSPPEADGSSNGTRRPSLVLALCGIEEFEGGFDKPSRGPSLTSSASWRRSLAIVGRTPASAGAGASAAAAASPTKRQHLPASGPAGASRVAAAVNAPQDFVDFLLASSTHNDTAAAAAAAVGGGGGGDIYGTFGSGGAAAGGGLAADGLFASLVTIGSVDTAAHHRMDVLMNSIQATLQEAAADSSANCAFGDDLDQLELVEELGRGGGGVVLRGIMSGSMQVAVKLMVPPGEAARELGWSPEKVRRGMLRNAMELAVQSSLSHPNIVQFYATFRDAVLRARHPETRCWAAGTDPVSLYLQDAAAAGPRRELGPDEDEARVTVILAEFCDGGSLADALAARSFPRLARRRPPTLGMASGTFMYDLKGVYMTLLDVALALRHLHSLNLVHRDIKPANLLLKSNPRDHRGFTVKLADFGFVLQLTETGEDGTRYARVDEPCGTVTHLAPECMTRKSQVTAAADIYSFGILMWELLAGGCRPFPTLLPNKILGAVHRGCRPAFSPDVPQPYQSLAQLCWRTEPARRPNAGQLVNAITAHVGVLGC